MGREVKRVAPDFDWPLREVWKGFINPHYEHCKRCPYCDGSGYNPETKQISDDWYDFANTGRKWCYNITQHEVDALIEHNCLKDFTHMWTREDGWKKIEPPPKITAEQVNEWSQRSTSLFSGADQYVCVRARAEREGVWGLCETCKGDGNVWTKKGAKEAYELWEPEEPPAGEGWQIWETVSEGSPISPVFDTPEKLARWLADTGASAFGYETATYEQWMCMIDAGWVPTAVGGHTEKGFVLQSGVAASCEYTKEVP